MPTVTPKPKPPKIPTAKLMIGSDPEMCFGSPIDNATVEACEYLEDSNHRQPFGLDGCSSTAELRPKPTTDPLTHAENIRKILLSKKNDKTLYQLGFFSSDSRVSIGGHVHFGHPRICNSRSKAMPFYSKELGKLYIMRNGNVIDATTKKRPKDSFQVDANVSRLMDKTIANLVTNLDTLLTFPLMFTEIEKHAQKRKGSYGKLGDHRRKEYGMEYRPLPSWLANEKLTKSVLCLAYAIGHESILNNYLVKESIKSVSGFENCFNRHNTRLLRPFLKETKKAITTELPLYKKYKKEIDYLLYHSTRNNPILQTEIKLGWNIPHRVVKNIVLMSAKELVDKITNILSIKVKTSNGGRHTFVLGSPEDFQTKEIGNNLNKALNSVLPNTDLVNQGSIVVVYGRKKEKGERIDISYDKNRMTTVKAKRLQKIIQELLKTYKYKRKVSVNLYPQPPYEWNSRDHNTEKPVGMRVGLGRKIREENSFLAETITFTCLMFANQSIYKSYTVDRITGNKKTLPLLVPTLLTPVKDSLVGVEKHEKEPVNKVDNSPLSNQELE